MAASLLPSGKVYGHPLGAPRAVSLRRLGFAPVLGPESWAGRLNRHSCIPKHNRKWYFLLVFAPRQAIQICPLKSARPDVRI